MANNPLSKTQIDRLGNRLKKGSHSESDLLLLDEYRRSFGDAYEVVARTIIQRGAFPSGRLPKSTRSIVEKLRRESIRLSQIQDIAGCRVVVTNIAEQEQFVASLRSDFPGASVIDRRDKPSFGYRAVHVIVEVSGKPIEIQVRTALQHKWAELSEKSSDVIDPTIKYGGGPKEWRRLLTESSEMVTSFEMIEREYFRRVALTKSALAAHEESENAAKEIEHYLPDHIAKEMRGRVEDSRRKMAQFEHDLEELRGEMVYFRKRNADHLSMAISWLDDPKRLKQ